MTFEYEQDAIYLRNDSGAHLAEVTFSEMGNGVVDINHTFVDSSLRGQGMANKLLTNLAQHLRENNQKAYPTCSYAVKWFESHPEFSDIYAKRPQG